MLTRLRLRNFRSWTDTGDLALKPITAFFGTNSSGKTSLLQSLVLLKQTAEASDRRLVFHYGGNGSAVDFGDYGTLAKEKRPLAISLDWETTEQMKVWHWRGDQRHSVAEATDLGFEVRVAPAKVAAGKTAAPTVVEEFAYRVGAARFGLRRSKGKGKGEYDVFLSGVENFLTQMRGRPYLLSAPVKCYGFPAEARARYTNADFMNDLERGLEQQLDLVRYLGPLRARPDRRYIWSGTAPEDIGVSGENVVTALLASRARGRVIKHDPSPGTWRRTVEQQVAACLQQMHLIHEFKVVELGAGTGVFAVHVRQSNKSPWTALPDVGFGVSQILPVLVLCFYAPEGATIVLEQPELHLHPSAQAALGDVLVEAAKIRKIQIVLESHSEHLLLRLQRRIAEEKASANQIALYFCQIRDGDSNATRLELDDYGTISNWPEQFFGDSFGEVAERTMAIQKRRRAAAE